MQVSDEIKKRNKLISLTFVDFLDAIGRMAELVSPPEPSRLAEHFHPMNLPGTLTPVWEYYKEVGEAEATQHARASSSFVAGPDTRPLFGST
jgi:hypothetical protein